jgi:polar amino acid transport system substrate-binding protein
MKRITVFLVLMVFLVSCGVKGKTYLIGIDPSYYPTPLGGKEANVYAFSNDLLRAISHEEGVFFEIVTVAWDSLTDGLKRRQYEGMLSSLTPRPMLERVYMFSESFLSTGPVLVIRKGVKVSSVNYLKGKEVGVNTLNNEALLMEEYPGVNIHYYDSIPNVLDEIVSDQIDGILIDYFLVSNYLRNLYYGKVSIATPPLNNAGLRLISLEGENEELIKVFNRGLDKLRSNGVYEKLLKKWELN